AVGTFRFLIWVRGTRSDCSVLSSINFQPRHSAVDFMVVPRIAADFAACRQSLFFGQTEVGGHLIPRAPAFGASVDHGPPLVRSERLFTSRAATSVRRQPPGSLTSICTDA